MDEREQLRCVLDELALPAERWEVDRCDRTENAPELPLRTKSYRDQRAG
jgi:hypothetical protein